MIVVRAEGFQNLENQVHVQIFVPQNVKRK